MFQFKCETQQMPPTITTGGVICRHLDSGGGAEHDGRCEADVDRSAVRHPRAFRPGMEGLIPFPFRVLLNQSAS